MSVSEFAREALEAKFGYRVGESRRPPFVGLISSEHTDLSERVEEILRAELPAAVERDRDP
jgi:hypothetical protein